MGEHGVLHGSGTCRQHLQQLLARLTEVGSQHGLHAMGGSHHLLLRGVLYRRGEQQPAADMLSWAGNGLDDTEREDEPTAGEICLAPTRFPGCPSGHFG